MRTYTGIGSRTINHSTHALLRTCAGHLKDHGWTLRSGHAPGADQAFEIGAGNASQIFLPWPRFESARACPGGALVMGEPLPDAYAIAANHHPVWHSLPLAAQKLHARNSHEVLGPELSSPSSFVLCWTKDSKGGTEQALRIARAHGIRIFDVADDFVREHIEQWCESGMEAIESGA